MSRRVISWVLILALMILVMGLSVPSNAKVNNVNIGLIATITGSLSEIGNMGVDGAKLAVENINKTGGIKALGGAKINLVIGDTTSDFSQSVLVAERVLSNNKLSGILSPDCSGMALAVAPVIEKAQVPYLSSAIADNLTQLGYKYVFQFCPKSSHFGALEVEFLRYLKNQFGLASEKVAIVYENSAMGVSTSKGIREPLEKAGFKIIVEEAYPKSLTDAAPIVTKVRAAGAEVLFPCSYSTDSALIISTMNAMNYHPAIIGGGSGFIWPDFYKALGKKTEGVFSVGSWSWDTKQNMQDKEAQRAIKSWSKTHKTYMPEIVGETYAAVYMLKEAMEISKSSDPKVIRNTLAKIKITKGAGAMMPSGIVEFDEFGWNKHVHPTMIQWQNGTIRTVFPLEDATAKVIWPIK